MSDSLPILVLGAASAIAQAYTRRRAPEGARFILVGRDQDRLVTIAADLVARGAISAEPFVADLAAIDRIEGNATALRSRFGDFREIVVAYGTLGDQHASEARLELARQVIDSNFTSAALWLLALLKDRQTDTALAVIGIGSVAGDRGRASNFIYGAAKAGFEVFLEGLAQKFAGTSVNIVTVKPGLVDTPMTAAMTRSGPLWSKPDKVAADIQRAVQRNRRVVYTPWFWWPIMIIIRHLPWFVFKRLKI